MITRCSTSHSKKFSGEGVYKGASHKRYNNDCQMWTYEGDITAMFTTSHDLPYVAPRFLDSTAAKQRQICSEGVLTQVAHLLF